MPGRKPLAACAELAAAIRTRAPRRGRYSSKIQQRPLPTTTTSCRPYPALAGIADKRPTAPLVQDEEARARRVPDEVVDRRLSRPLPDNTADTATWLDARALARGGTLIRKNPSPA